MARKWWTLIAVCTGVFMLLLDVTIVNVALPDIQREFGASLTDLQWVIDAYALTLAAFLLTAGTIADKCGRRLVFAVGLASSPWFAALRRGQLAGAAVRLGGQFRAWAARSCSRRPSRCWRARSRRVSGASPSACRGRHRCGGGGGAGTRRGAHQRVSWRWIFFVNLPIGIAALAVTLRRSTSRGRRPRTGWTGRAA